MQTIQLNISGKVQGVGYRCWFAEQAIALGLKWYVKNLSSGEVEAVITGTDAQLQAMIARNWQGSTRGQVQDIVQENVQATLEIQDFKRVFS